ncbi:MAG: hypothetical protein PVF17_03945 [Ignavibacteria bacterium]
MKYSLIAIVVCIIIFIFNSCSDDPTSLGSNLLDNDFIFVSSFDSQEDSLAQTSSYFKEVISLGFSTTFHIGRRDNLEASSLLRFAFSVEDSMQEDFLQDRIVINRAYIELTPVDTFTNASEPLDFSVHKINNDWSISGFTVDDIQSLNYDMVDLSSNKTFTDTLYTFDIDNDVILSWLKSSIDTSLGRNYGLFIKPDITSGKIISFEAFTVNSANAAKLKIVIEKQGNYIDTLRGFIFGDISVVTSELPVLPAGEIGVQSGTSVRSKLFLDLSTIPKNVIINKAELFIQQDTVNSIVGTGGNTSLAIYNIIDPDSNLVDEFNRFTLLRNDNYIYTADVTSLVSYWYTGAENYGMIITPFSEIEGLNLVALKGSDYPVELERPRLKIIYTAREEQ